MSIDEGSEIENIYPRTVTRCVKENYHGIFVARKVAGLPATAMIIDAGDLPRTTVALYPPETPPQTVDGTKVSLGVIVQGATCSSSIIVLA